MICSEWVKWIASNFGPKITSCSYLHLYVRVQIQSSNTHNFFLTVSNRSIFCTVFFFQKKKQTREKKNSCGEISVQTDKKKSSYRKAIRWKLVVPVGELASFPSDASLFFQCDSGTNDAVKHWVDRIKDLNMNPDETQS